ncbi:bifunctional diaminohydroxyphosphoribosylaminopyrimidine deaminase/5-amino-6-(5-phosphoribosylamino)uracil reductase RibD [Vicingaceae bacterium]|nr:bifunctional diaminohydroxyphosphoribosylaminopyrimidine deaminase/5-amino-6-(5-phosphoribosylamino)uracil reductase RibD [Vicingaceae bacterium]MDB4060766.1 bifunctional diaminohydroxyphosphoribosylaminopyrimidine deaminase/5-amino-6-(5-phosphoribosylamino)uracil reductase RibD [Vicingaceae bacterium]
MNRALQLAALGNLNAAPNPLVGAVVVHEGKIIGEGYHRACGEAHAEVNAIQSVSNKSLLSESTMYVTLEPCTHFGKTPPCADLIVQHNFKRVVICNLDPFEKVAGNGIKKLLAAGIEFESGCLEKKGRHLNRRFFCFHEKKRPYIILKWAESADGFIGKKNEQVWLTGSISKQLVHLWRAEESAILVGKNTAIIDNPELTVREVTGKNPTRFLVDKNLEVPNSSKIHSNESNTIVLNSIETKQQKNIDHIKINFENGVPTQVAKVCFDRNITSIIIEGGAKTLQQFIDSNLWDEARVFSAKKTIYKGVNCPTLKGTLEHSEKLENDTLNIYSNPTA